MPNPLRVLIVEDSESDADLVVRLLAKAGYEVTSQRVETRDTMQSALMQDTWDSVIADHNMPEFDAFAALETLRSSGLDIPFIVASGSIGEETAVSLMKAGAADYVMKDKMARLTVVIDRELRDAATRRERRQAVDALRANEEKYHQLFDLESDALFLIERDTGRILEANAGATALYGYSHDQWLTMRNVDVSAEPDSTTSATLTGVTDIPLRWHRKKDGTVFPVDIAATHFVWQGRPVHLAAIRDITERVRAQEALRAERDRAAAYLQIAGVVLLALDVQGKITLINRRGCELLGYAEDELLGKDWFATCLPSTNLQTIRTVFARILTGDDQQSAEFVNPVVTKSGELRLISWRNSLLRGADGRPLGMLSSGEDITERTRAEAALRESEEHFRGLYENSTLGLYRTTPEGRILLCNPALAQMLGYSSPEELAQRDLRQDGFALPGQRNDFLGRIERDDQVLGLESAWLRKDCTVVHVRESATAVRDGAGRVLFYDGTVEDVTERYEAEEQLRRSEADLRQAQHVVHVGSWRWDIKPNHLTGSDEIYRIFGVTKEGFSWSLPDVIARAIHPDDRQKVEASIVSVSQQGKPIPLECRVVWPDGSVHVVWAEAGELTEDEAGKPATLTGIVLDITERKRIEDALRDSNTLLERTLAGLDEAVFVVSVETRRILMCSQAVERVFGYRPEELVGETTQALHFSQESFQDFVRRRISLTGPDGIARLEYQMRRRDGSVFWSENTVADLKSEPGGPPMVVSVVRDITHRKRAEQALRESEARLRDITFSMADWVWEVDENGVYTYSSQKGSDFFGPPDRNIIGKTPFDLMPPDEAKRVAAIFSEIVANKAPIKDLENWNIKENGERLCLLTNGVPILDEEGHLKGYRGVDKDITERKRAEEALRESEDRYRDLVEHSHDLICTHDLQGWILSVNPAATTLLGIGEDALLTMNLRDILVPEVRDQFAEYLVTIQRDGTASGLMLVQTSRGEKRIWDYSNTLRTEGVAAPIVRGMVRDITDRKQAEDMIRASLREKELLLKEIHHRVKNNLQVIASLLTLQAQSVRDPVALEVLQDSQNRIRAMSLIHAKLYESSDLARVDFGAFVRDLGTILLRAYAVNPSAIHLQVHAGQADLDIDTLVPCSLIVNELLANAVKHAFPAGVKGTISVRLSQKDGAYTLRVADNGVGFPGEVDFRNTKSLGLRLVNMLVEQLDGTIELLNKGGTEFTIRFQRGASV